VRIVVAVSALIAGIGLATALLAQTAQTDAGAVAADAGTSSPVADPDAGSPAKSAEKLHAEGVRLLRERRMQAAIGALERAAALDEKSALYATDLGYAYLVENRLGEAEAAFKQGITLDPTRPHAYAHLVECVLREPNRWEKRWELFGLLDRGILSNSELERRLKIEVARIRAERSFGLFERAREHIEAALRQHPPRALEKQILDLRTSLGEEEKARRSMRDWPEPELSAKVRERFAQCEQISQTRGKKETLACLAELLEPLPAWRAPRRLRVKILTEQGYYDEAVKELTTLVRLEPSEPQYYRQLGLLLAEHGGLLELDRADEALRIAIALEPEWTELIQFRQQLASRRFDTLAPAKRTEQTTPTPSENARRLYEEAEANLDEGPEGRASALPLLDQALREAPAFVEAAALSFGLSRRVPDKTVEALWHDGPGMFALYQECAHVEPALPRAVLDRWLTRAIELGSNEARLTRALNQRGRGDKAGAERELANYLALVSNREEVESVQLLRSELLEKPRSAAALLQEAILNSRLRLQADDLDGALRQLDAPCRNTMELERLLWLGIVYERLAQVPEALGCYEFGLDQGPSGEARSRIVRRYARLLARAEARWLSAANAAKLAELSSSEPVASWALARRALDAGQVDAAKAYASRYLAAARPDDRFVPLAQAMQKQLLASDRLEVERRQRRLRSVIGSVTIALLALGIISYFLWFRGVTAARAIRRKPKLFPELRRIVGYLRHDILKHRTSALELLAQDPSTLPKLRSTLLEPSPVSAVVAEAYARLCIAARGQGVTLRRLAREPVFGALVHDLRLIERSLDDLSNARLIRELDVRLRTVHRDRINQLLSEGPRFQLDAVTLQNWIAAVEAEMTNRGRSWAVPALQMSDLQLSFPVDAAALFQMFSNLLRNAEAVTAGTEEPKVLVRLQREVDFSGRVLVKLQIADNAAAELSEASVESRPPDRGLGIVRDTARDWHGRVFVQRESLPYVKSVGVEFTP